MSDTFHRRRRRESMSTPALVATCWTSAGNVAPLDQPETSPFSAIERVHAVASTGWAGIGFGQDDLKVSRDTVGFPTIRAEIDAAGLQHVETLRSKRSNRRHSPPAEAGSSEACDPSSPEDLAVATVRGSHSASARRAAPPQPHSGVPILHPPLLPGKALAALHGQGGLGSNAGDNRSGLGDQFGHSGVGQ